MLFINGTYLNNTKSIYINLSYIYGIGISKSKQILKKLNINENLKIYELTTETLNYILQYISTNYKIEKKLRIYHKNKIRNLIFIKSYRGRRHYRKLPVRGQRTHSNCRTCKYI